VHSLPNTPASSGPSWRVNKRSTARGQLCRPADLTRFPAFDCERRFTREGKQVRPMPGAPDNSAGRIRGRQRDEDQACGLPSGPGARSSNSEAGYTRAIRPCQGAFFQIASPIGGSPYTLLGAKSRSIIAVFVRLGSVRFVGLVKRP
jgi:hypothetical protein